MTDRREAEDRKVREFGLMMGGISCLVGIYLLWKDVGAFSLFFVAGGLLVAGGLFARRVLRPLYRGWMKLAHGLAWINTRLVLGVFFYLIFTPIGLFLRLTGKDLLNTNTKRQSPTYWIKRTDGLFDPGRYRRLF